MSEQQFSAKQAVRGQLYLDTRPVPRVTRLSLDGFTPRPVAHRPVEEAADVIAPLTSLALQVATTVSDEALGRGHVAPDDSMLTGLDIALPAPPEKNRARRRGRGAKRAKRQPRETSEKRLPVGRLVTGVIVMIGVGLAFYKTVFVPSSQVLSARDEIAATVADAAIVYEPKTTEIAPPDNYLSSYTVEADSPKLISIPSLALQARILPVGVDGRGHPRLPIHSYDVGWYNVSARPGKPGAVVVSGACTTPVIGGVFGALRTILKGDEIVIERGDGVVFRYRVMQQETVQTDSLDMMKVLKPVDEHAPGLTIVTCAGRYDQKTNDMSARLVIYARQI